MSRLIAVLVLVVGGLSACEKTQYVQQEDAGVQEDAGLQDDAAAQCGPETYPCPPYGNVPGTVIENVTFTGWVDDNGDGDPLNDPYRTWGLADLRALGRSGQAMFVNLNGSAGWCTFCKAENRVLPGVAADYKDKGIVFAEFLFEDYDHNPAGKDFVYSWADFYNLPFPVGVDATFKMGRYFDAAASPANIVIALRDLTLYGEHIKAMQIVAINMGFDEQAMRAELDDLAANAQ